MSVRGVQGATLRQRFLVKICFVVFRTLVGDIVCGCATTVRGASLNRSRGGNYGRSCVEHARQNCGELHTGWIEVLHSGTGDEMVRSRATL